MFAGCWSAIYFSWAAYEIGSCVLPIPKNDAKGPTQPGPRFPGLWAFWVGGRSRFSATYGWRDDFSDRQGQQEYQRWAELGLHPKFRKGSRNGHSRKEHDENPLDLGDLGVWSVCSEKPSCHKAAKCQGFLVLQPCPERFSELWVLCRGLWYLVTSWQTWVKSIGIEIAFADFCLKTPELVGLLLVAVSMVWLDHDTARCSGSDRPMKLDDWKHFEQGLVGLLQVCRNPLTGFLKA